MSQPNDHNPVQRSIVYQLLEECAFNCPICHKRELAESVAPTKVHIARVQTLKERLGIKRITLSGGEPMHLDFEEELLPLIKEIHQKKIHICLNTTGYQLTMERLRILDNYVDQILLSFRGIDKHRYNVEFGIKEDATKNGNAHFENALALVENIRKTGIRLEVSTVVHRQNMDEIIPLGWKLLSINPNLTWRVEEYYANGRRRPSKKEEDPFELGKARYDDMFIQLAETFSGKFFRLRHSSKESRIDAPDLMLTPAGKLVRSHQNRYDEVGYIDEIDKINLNRIGTRRTKDDYNKGFRDWGWGDL